jgi:hypothetical protein
MRGTGCPQHRHRKRREKPQKTDRKKTRTDPMAITSDRVREIFKGLENGDGDAFFERVADDVDWTVMGTHCPPQK